MKEILGVVLEWQLVAYFIFLTIVLVTLKIVKAPKKWFKVSFWSIVITFVTLLSFEFIYLSFI